MKKITTKTKLTKNQASILLTSVSAGLIILAVLLLKYSGNIPPSYVILGILLLEVLYVIPRFNTLYYKIRETNMGKEKILSFIPIFQYTCCMRQSASIIVKSLFVFTVLLGSLSFSPSLLELLFDTNDFLLVDEIFPMVVVIDLTVFNILIGIGLAQPINDINNFFKTAFPDNDEISGVLGKVQKVMKLVPFLGFICLALPLLRVIPVLLCIDKMKDLVSLGLTESKIEEDFK